MCWFLLSISDRHSAVHWRIRKASKPISLNIYVTFYLLEIQVALVKRVPRKLRPKILSKSKNWLKTPSKFRKLRPKTPSKSRKLRPKTPSKSRKLWRLKQSGREGVKTLCSTQNKERFPYFSISIPTACFSSFQWSEEQTYTVSLEYSWAGAWLCCVTLFCLCNSGAPRAALSAARGRTPIAKEMW